MHSKDLNIKNTFRVTGFFIPFTWYFILFAACSLLGYQWLQNRPKIPDTAYSDIFSLLLKIAIWFCGILILLALVSVLVSLIFVLWEKRKKGITLQTESSDPSMDRSNSQLIRIQVYPVLKPVLGFIKIRLKYDEENYSDKFSIVETPSDKLIRTTLEGVYYWPLPEIKEYRIDRAILYFEDFFQFFSIAVPIKTSSHFYTRPAEAPQHANLLAPRKTEDALTRIEELKRVEGEYISYKNFETHDDVRRIVWKIYAKNKDLVVRIPEIQDPYASHIYLYASFYSNFEVSGNETVEIPFLNYYKTVIWSLYRQLARQGFEVRFVPDQPVTHKNFNSKEELISYTISTSEWQRERDLKNYVKFRDAGMVILSSLSNAEEVRELVDEYGGDLTFILVELSRSLNKQQLGDWLQWIFVQQEKDATAVYKSSWSLSFLRTKIIRNEKKLRKIISASPKASLVQN